MRKVAARSAEEMYGDMPMSATKILPGVNFDAETLPEAKNWEVGKTYKVTLNIKMRGSSERKSADGKEHGNFDFDVVGIEAGREVKAKEKVARYSGGRDYS